MRSLQRALSSLLTLFFGPRADGREHAPWTEIVFWVVVLGLLAFLVNGWA